MQQKVSLQLLPHQLADAANVITAISNATGKKEHQITGFLIHKQSIDARGKPIWINCTVNAFIEILIKLPDVLNSLIILIETLNFIKIPR